MREVRATLARSEGDLICGERETCQLSSRAIAVASTIIKHRSNNRQSSQQVSRQPT